jgi:uncharacterized membrane protein
MSSDGRPTGPSRNDSGGALVATLSVWKFNDTSSAERSVQVLQQLQSQELIKVLDAATVVWEEGKKKPKTRQLNNLTGAGALGGAFWGLLFGMLFFVPLLGLAVGAATGALTGSLSDVGIDDAFIKSVRDQVKPGTSALFVMTSGAVQDKVLAAVKDAGLHAELVHTNLSDEQESKLREAFSE